MDLKIRRVLFAFDFRWGFNCRQNKIKKQKIIHDKCNLQQQITFIVNSESKLFIRFLARRYDYGKKVLHEVQCHTY